MNFNSLVVTKGLNLSLPVQTWEQTVYPLCMQIEIYAPLLTFKVLCEKSGLPRGAAFDSVSLHLKQVPEEKLAVTHMGMW